MGGRHGTDLSETKNQDWPRFVAGASTNDTANVLSREPCYSEGFDQINTFTSDYNSMYNSLQVQVNKRYSRGLTLMGNYTFSSATQQQGCRYLADWRLDYYSPGTVHAMAAAFRYQIPRIFRQDGVASSILDGWAVGGSGNACTGGYGSIGDYNCNEFNFNSAGCYATYLGGGVLLHHRKNIVTDASGNMLGVSWVDPSKFVRADQSMINGVPTTLPDVGQRLFLGNAANGLSRDRPG